MLSVGMLLDHLGLAKSGAAVRKGVAAVLKAGKPRTPDLGGSAKTTEVADAVLGALEKV
jgi:isocitrate/isopropylmalate dehydrogenase